jgi:hypothetical protein
MGQDLRPLARMGRQNFIDRCVDNKSYQTQQHKELFALLDSPLSFGSWMGWDLRPLARMERQNFIDRCVDNKSYQYFPNILDDPEKVDFGEFALEAARFLTSPGLTNMWLPKDAHVFTGCANLRYVLP